MSSGNWREISAISDSHSCGIPHSDIELCAAFDISEHEELEMHHNFPGIESLRQTLRATYTEPEDAATS